MDGGSESENLPFEDLVFFGINCLQGVCSFADLWHDMKSSWALLWGECIMSWLSGFEFKRDRRRLAS